MRFLLDCWLWVCVRCVRLVVLVVGLLRGIGLGRW